MLLGFNLRIIFQQQKIDLIFFSFYISFNGFKKMQNQVLETIEYFNRF